MKRIMIIGGIALAVLTGAGAAFAAASDFNSYSATNTFSASAVGSPRHPAPAGFSEVWAAKGTNGHPAAPLTKLVSKIYGYRTNGKDFPVCTARRINTLGANSGKWNKVCPKGALIGQGPVNAEFVNPNAPYNVVGTCNPYLYVYNGGQDKQVFFFTEDTFTPNASKYRCLNGSIHTGSAPAYTGNISTSGKTWLLTIPFPASVSTNAGGTHLYASLLHLHVDYAKKTTRKNGKTVGYGESVACQSNKRPWSFAYTAKNYNGLSPSTGEVPVSGSASC